MTDELSLRLSVSVSVSLSFSLSLSHTHTHISSPTHTHVGGQAHTRTCTYTRAHVVTRVLAISENSSVVLFLQCVCVRVRPDLGVLDSFPTMLSR